jgi:CHAT domain-containing protein
VLLVCATLKPLPSWAQYDEIESHFRRPSASEEKSLREILAEPVPESALYEGLRRLFKEKRLAAARLGDEAAHEAVLRQAAARLPDAVWTFELGSRLISRGQIEEGNRWRAESARRVNDVTTRSLYLSSIAVDLALQVNDAAARAQLVEMRDLVQSSLSTARSSPERLLLRRALANGSMAESILEQRAGHHDNAIRAARQAEEYARDAWGLLSSRKDEARPAVALEISESLSRRLDAQRTARRYEDAERTLNEYVRVSSEFELAPKQMADLYLQASSLRFDRRMFSDAADLARKSDAVLAGLGADLLHPRRVTRSGAMLAAYIGQRNLQEAAKLLGQIDELAGEDEKLKLRVGLFLERGMIYLATEREVEASEAFGHYAEQMSLSYGATHFFTAQARGLQGAALWRSDSKASREDAVPLLRAAMQLMMEPANADYVENIGLRLTVRDLIADAYLEVVAETSHEEALASMQVADWIRTGLVREALEDAAARSAASSPALMQWVRQDQEMRNEGRSLRKYMDGTGGAIDLLLPNLAAKTRDRINELERQRSSIQASIKERYPDYESKIRPRQPNPAEVAAHLAPDEALVALLPTERAVYVWAIGANGQGVFHREPMTRFELGILVRRLRRTLDFNEMEEGALRPFDRAAAAELYLRLLEPLHSVLDDKKHLLIVSSGSLAEIPFGVLITQTSGPADAPTPWLIRQAAVSHEPSISAWLALRRLLPSKSLQEPFMAWGDPAFKIAGPTSKPATVAVAMSTDPEGNRRGGVHRSAFVKRALSLDKLEDRASAATRYGESLPALPETRDELLAIAATMRADASSDLKLGALATRESVLAASKSGALARKRVIAFATHGLMAGDLPGLTQPALAMAATAGLSSDPMAALLTLDDVSSLQLNADWVVLSACNTAASDGEGAEALSGLARGFFFAGARSVLATHWAVDSDSAKMLTTATFAHYAANDSSRKAESLRQAMLGVMTKRGFEHPAFWAPYALVGDGGR